MSSRSSIPLQTSIRSAATSDYEAICLLYEQLDQLHRTAWPDLYADAQPPSRSREFLQRIIADGNSSMLVAECQGTVAGLIYGNVLKASTTPTLRLQAFATIQELIVQEARRGMGIGRALYEAWARWARQKGAEAIQLSVASFNESAIRFYLKLGFKEQLKVMFLEVEPTTLGPTVR